MKADLYVEFGGNKVDHKQLIDMAKSLWKSEGRKVKDLTSVELFFKPEENACYYVFNKEHKGYFDV